MATTPKAFGLYSTWNFYLAGGSHRVLYQIAPQIARPVEDIIPYIKECVQTMKGKDHINIFSGKLNIFCTPNNNGLVLSADKLNRRMYDNMPEYIDFSKLPIHDLSEVFRMFWYEIKTEGELRAISPRYNQHSPSYAWHIWYYAKDIEASISPGIELAFTMYDAKGNADPLFTVERTDVESLVDALSAPSALESIFKL